MNFASLLNTDWFSFLNKWGKWWSYLCAEVKRFLSGSSKNKRQKFLPSDTPELSTRPDHSLIQELSSIWMSSAGILRNYKQETLAKIRQCKAGILFPLHTEKKDVWQLKVLNFFIFWSNPRVKFSIFETKSPLTLKTLYLNATKTSIWEYFFHPNISFIKYSASTQSQEKIIYTSDIKSCFRELYSHEEN